MSDQASQYRAMLWLFVLAAVACLYPAIQGIRGLVPKSTGFLGGVASVGCLFLGAWYGLRGAKIRIAERQRKADAVALITLAAFLKDKSEEDLQKAIAKGGPAGEAAALVLERRRTGLTTRPSQQISPQPEVN
jgi:hypothetical protein